MLAVAAAVVVVVVVIVLVAGSGSPVGTYIGKVGRSANGTALSISKDEKELLFTFSGPEGLSAVYTAEHMDGRDYQLTPSVAAGGGSRLSAELRRNTVTVTGWVLPVGEVSITYDRRDVE